MNNDDQKQSEISTALSTNDAPSQAGAQHSSEVSLTENDLAGAFREVGHQIAELFRAVGENERVRKLQQEFASGVQNLAEQVSQGAQNLSKSEAAKSVQEQASKVAEHPVMQDLGSRLNGAVSDLANGISRMAEQARTGSASATASSPASDDSSDIVEPLQLALPGNEGQTSHMAADALNQEDGSGEGNASSTGDLSTSKLQDGPLH